MNKEQFRFLLEDGRWTRWFRAEENLSFLNDQSSVLAVETIMEMTTTEFKERYPEIDVP